MRRACTAHFLLAAVLTSCTPAENDGLLHVWLHYDYMVAADHSHAPSKTAVQVVVDAFRKHDVILHIDPVHKAIPEHTVIVFDLPGSPWTSLDPNCAGPDAVSFTALKAQYFHPPLEIGWHYAIFGHYHTTDSTAHAANCSPDPETGALPDPLSVGYASLPGKDFIVAMANLEGSWTDFETNLPVPTPVYDPMVAATLMHELGHNLGLQHGGDESVNQKPNYVSIMNYLYSGNPIPIITYSTTTPSGYSLRVDYSDEKLPDLVETNLDETVGLQSTHPDDAIFWFLSGMELISRAVGPIDWDNDGSPTATGVMIDLNNSGGAPAETLTGFDDWTYVRQQIANPTSQKPRGVH